MAKIDLSAARKDAEKQGQIGTGVFKVQEGANRIRLVAGPLPHSELYQGEKRFKWLTYVLDRSDGQVKPYFMPHSIYKMLEALQRTEDYAFEDVPMPYDLTINAKGAGTREVEYSLVPARKSTPLTSDEMNALDAKQPIEQFQQQLREKKGETERTFDPDEIPV